jgi:adenylate cyclase
VAAGTARDAPADETVRVRLLGQFAITSGGRDAGPWPRPSAKRLCELVIVSPGRRVSRDLACDELFPRLEPRAAARALSKALSMARVALTGLGEPGASLLAADLNHIWVAPAVEVDADRHEEALRAGLATAAGQDRDDRLSAALTQEGELLEDEPYADWAARPRERLQALRQEARLAIARDRAKGHFRISYDDVMAAWQRCLDHDPACEEAAAALVRGYVARGRPELAARVFERCRTALEDLGLRISPSLERVYATATREPEPGVPVPRAPVTPSPVPPLPVPPGSVAPVLVAPAGAAAPVAPVATVAPAGLSAAALAEPSPLPREERRPVSVLFAEVAAPAGLAGAVGLEMLREIVGGSLAAVIAEVEALGGTVISVSGRGLQAMFGAPEAHEDDPERAVRAAFRALAATAAAADGGTALRIGVETGPAVVGPIGGGAKVEYGALGDVVSVAAALQSSARPGSVLVGPATRAVVGHLFTWGAGEEVALGGSTRPLVANYLDAPRARVAERRPGLGGSAPLTGRAAEMRVIDTALRQAVGGRGSLIVLTAEPGLGKTRLVQECRKRFIAWVGAGSGRLPLWLEGRCASYASGTPYSLYRQLIASWVGVAPDQPGALLRHALETSLTHLMGNTNLLAPLARMMGVAHPAARARMSPEEQHRLTFAAMRSVVSRFAAAGPTVLILEDLHWADPTSAHLTRHLAELAAGRPLLVLATSRPDAGPEVASLTDIPGARQIRLRPLGAEAAEALAKSLIGESAGPEVLATVLATAEGNPLFLEERLSSLLETRTLVREQGTWRLRTTPGPRLPEVLERLVRARVDRLSAAAQEAIRAAAVLGPEFTAATLAVMLGTEPLPLVPVLDELTASDLVHREPPTGAARAFRFRHALIQEATYLGLLRAERRDLHARAAAAVEAASRDRLPEVAAVLGRHYAAAEDTERAVRYLEMAGDHATDAFANEEAIGSFRTALAVIGRAGAGTSAAGGRAPVAPVVGRTAAGGTPEHIAASGMAADAVRLYAKLANVVWRIGRFDEARDAFQAALRLAGPLDALQRAHLYARLGRLEMVELRYDAALAAFDSAEALLGDDPGGGDDATVDQWLEIMLDGRADMHANRLEADEALAILEAVRPVLEARGGPARRTVFYRVLTMQRLLRNRLRVEEADIAALRMSIEAAAHTGEDKDLAYSMDFLGWAYWLRGNLAEATENLQQAHAMAERIGETLLREMALISLTVTAVRKHDTETVRTLSAQAIEMMDEADSRIAGVMSCQAWLAWQDGRPDEVLRLAALIADINPNRLGVGARYQWVHLFPVIAARLSSGTDAEALAEALAEAVAAARQILAPEQQLLADDLTAALESACAAWDRGDPATARHCLTSALTRAHELHYF